MEDSPHVDSLRSIKRIPTFEEEIISVTSVSVPGDWKQSAVRCKKRPRHRNCPGHIQICLASDGSIEWICSVCQDQGIIRNWKGSRYDLSNLPEQEQQPPFELVLTEEEYAEVKECFLNKPGDSRIIYGATFSNGGVVLRASLKDFNGFVDHLVFRLNREERWRNRRRILESPMPSCTGHREG